MSQLKSGRKAAGDFVPFQRMPFEKLPEKSIKPHPYYEARIEELNMTSRPFGKLRIHCRIYGSGPPLLLVHGLMTTGYSWRFLMPLLAGKFTLYIPDLPGSGRSDMPLDATYTAPFLAEWIGEFMSAAGIRGCPVIGNSLGGYLCLLLALQDPSCMSKLIDLHSPGLPEARFYALRVVGALPGIKTAFSWFVRRDPLRWAHNNVHYYDESLKSLEEAHEFGDPLAEPRGAMAFAKYMVETIRPGPMVEMRRRLIELKGQGKPFPVPLLLVYAEEDPLVPPIIGDRFAELIPSARLVRLPRASHFAHVDAPEAFARVALDFFGQV